MLPTLKQEEVPLHSEIAAVGTIYKLLALAFCGDITIWKLDTLTTQVLSHGNIVAVSNTRSFPHLSGILEQNATILDFFASKATLLCFETKGGST